MITMSTVCSICCGLKHKQNALQSMLRKGLILILKVFLLLVVALLIRLAEVHFRREFRLGRIFNHGNNFTITEEDLSWEQETANTHSTFPKLISKERGEHEHKSNLKGWIFTDLHDKPYMEIKTEMTSSLTHKFSPNLEEHVVHKFADPVGDNSFFMLSPALVQHNGQLHLFCRVMLDRMRYRYTRPQRFPLNQFLTNYVYHESFNQDLRSVSPGYILGIPTPVFPLDGDGAMDPRSFVLKNKVYLMVLLFRYVEDKLWKPYPLIWDVEENKALTPSVNITYNVQNPMEKNWTPLVVNDTLYLVHNVDPLRILQCDLDKPNPSCVFVHDQSMHSSPDRFTFERRKHTLRGGTPFLMYDWPYFISLAHSVIICQRPEAPFGRVRRYEANIVVLRADLAFRVVYVSNALQFSEGIFRNSSMVTYAGQILVENDFVYPVSVIKESSDSLAVGSHVNDHISVIVRLKGFSKLMDRIKSMDHATRKPIDPLKIQQLVKGNFPRPKESL